MRMKVLPAVRLMAGLCCVLAVAYCAPGCRSVNRQHPTCGQEASGGSEVWNRYAVQYDICEGDYTPGKCRPVFAIFWKHEITGGIGNDHDGIITSINGIALDPRPPEERKAIYILRPDYSLDELDLTEEEINHILDLVEDHQRMLYKDALWNAKVGPRLHRVEPPPGYAGLRKRYVPSKQSDW